MNLLKILHWTINLQKYSCISVQSTIRHIRWQSSDSQAKEELSTDVSTKVTPMKQSNLMEFFDLSSDLHESKVIHGEFFMFNNQD